MVPGDYICCRINKFVVMRKWLRNVWCVLVCFAVLSGCSVVNKAEIIGYARNGYVLDTENRVTGTYRNGYVFDKDNNVVGTYRNGYVVNNSDSIIARYSNGYILRHK